MRKIFLLIFLISTQHTQAQLPVIEVIKQATIKVIKAVDLKVQRLQNETIWLQNAQQTLENTLSKLQLREIGDWVEKQRALYADYFEELSKVKSAITTYHRVREVMRQQARLVAEYKRAYALFKNDQHFTRQEIHYMEEVYAGLLDQSVKNMRLLDLVMEAFATQMTDAKRLEIINTAADQVTQNYNDLQAFNNQNRLLSLQRAKTKADAEQVRATYGME